MAKLYDNNLKTPYQPQIVEEDKWIEYIIEDAKKFSPYFGQDVVNDLLGNPPSRFGRKEDKRLNFNAQRELVINFKQSYSKYDVVGEEKKKGGGGEEEGAPPPPPPPLAPPPPTPPPRSSSSLLAELDRPPSALCSRLASARAEGRLPVGGFWEVGGLGH